MQNTQFSEAATLVIDLPGAENEDDIRKCYNTFLATQEAEYLDRAIYMTQELVTSGATNVLLKSSKFLLACLHRIRNSLVAGAQDTAPVKEEKEQLHSGNDFQSGVLIIELPGAENEDIIQESYNAFLDTDEIEYLDSTICLVEELVATSPPEGLLLSSQLLLAGLWKVRENVTADTQRQSNHDMDDPQNKIAVQDNLQNKSSLDARLREALGLSCKLHLTYEETNDVRYLDDAIVQAKVMESLAYSKEHLEVAQLLLVVLRESRHVGETSRILGEMSYGSSLFQGECSRILGEILRESSLFQEAYELSSRFFTMYEATRKIEYLDIVIGQVEEMVQLASSREVSGYMQSQVGYLQALRDKIASEAGPQEVERNSLQEGVGENSAKIGDSLVAPWASEAYPNPIHQLSDLRNKHSSELEQLSTMEDLEQAINEAKGGVATTAPDSTSHRYFLDRAAQLLAEKYDRSGIFEDLAQAINYMEEIVAVTPSNDSGRVSAYLNLASLLARRYQRLGTPEDLKKAIEYVKDVLPMAPFDQAIKSSPEPYYALSYLLRCRYVQLGNLEDLEEAMKYIRGLIAAVPSDNPIQALALNLLTGVHFERSSRLGDTEDLEQAIKYSKNVITRGLPDKYDRACFNGNLALMFTQRFQRLGNNEDLELALKHAEDAEAAAATNPVDQGMISVVITNVFATRYARLGNLDDLELAIKYSKDSIRLRSSNPNSQSLGYNNLAVMLKMRYDRLGTIEDLQQCISYIRHALEVRLDSPHQAIMYNSMAEFLRCRYIHLGGLQDLEEAIKYARDGIALIPPEHPDRAALYNNLANMLLQRYGELQLVEDLENSIKCAMDAATAAPPGNANRVMALFTLTKMLFARYNCLGSQGDLEQAAKYIQEAISAIPFDNPKRAKYLYLQAEVATQLRGSEGILQGFELALHSSYEAWYSQASPPYNRIEAALLAADLLIPKKRWQEAASLLEDAVRMLPKLSSSSFRRADQERHFSTFTELVPVAASIALQAGEEAANCLRLLELGRGIIMNFVIDRRSDLSHLQLKHPETAQKFIQLSSEIDSPVAGMEWGNKDLIYQEPQQQRYQAAQELGETLEYIRGLTGFEGFQLPPHSHQLIALADEGPIVIFNTTKYRSDAIIITSSFIKSLPLPKLQYEAVSERISKIPELVQGKRRTYRWRNEVMKELLLWLWDVAVEPVLEELAPILKDFKPNIASTDSSLPRIWWIGAGPLSMAPFHAAGEHSPRSTRNTISRVVSSYTPTIKALSYARERKLELLSNQNSRLLLVNMPTTPGHKALRNSTVEVEAIVDIVKGRTTTTRLDHPSAAGVLEQLSECHAVHFSCHGVFNTQSPSQSHLLLRKYDGSGSETVDELTVETVSNTNIKHAQIAYLSACSTAQNASKVLADESIHIASGFQLAGFSHVLATQWISNDDACRQVSADFYHYLFSDELGGGKSQGHRKVSAALHYAVQKLRAENLSQPILWAPFIHTGA